MPHMSPISWTAIFMTMIILMIILTTMMYFLPLSLPPSKEKFLNTYNMMNWPW